MYYFHRDDEGQAWRLIGVAARSCIEMGLHRRESLLKAFNNQAEYLAAAKLFWVIYALDRRWSFGTGMPFALQDADIDPSLPEPVSFSGQCSGNLTNVLLIGRRQSLSSRDHKIQSYRLEGLVL